MEEKLKKVFFVPQALLKKMLLFIPASIGWILHAPLYYLILLLIKNRAEDHYDSVVVGLLFILYPIYLLVITILAYSITGSLWALLLLLIIPFTAWGLLQLKNQLNKT